MAPHERFNLPDRAALLARIEALGLDIPCSEDCGALLDSAPVGSRTAPNRCAAHPMEGRDADAHGAPGELALRRYGRFAAGGSGLIWFEATAVVSEGRASPRQLMLTRETADAFGRLVESTRRAARESMGAGHEPLLVLQLTHAGRYAAPGGKPAPVIARRDLELDTGSGAPGLVPVGDAELDRLQESFVAAAGLAASAGFDGVDVKACHGYLVSELLAAFDRGDSRYGGSFENRSRFLIETVGRIARSYPDLIVASRINAFDDTVRADGFGAAAGAGPDLTEARELARLLHSAGATLLNVSAGIPYRNPHVGRPFNIPVAGGVFPDEHPLEGVARLIAAAADLHAAAPGLAVVSTGFSWLRQHFAEVCAGVVRSGRATFAGVGRNAFAYPDWVRDLMDHGRIDPKKTCIACSGCSQIMRSGESTGCVVRDREVYAPRRRGRPPGKGAES